MSCFVSRRDTNPRRRDVAGFIVWTSLAMVTLQVRAVYPFVDIQMAGAEC